MILDTSSLVRQHLSEWMMSSCKIWRRHNMESLSTLLTFCVDNPSVAMFSHHIEQVIENIDGFFFVVRDYVSNRGNRMP